MESKGDTSHVSASSTQFSTTPHPFSNTGKDSVVEPAAGEELSLATQTDMGTDMTAEEHI